LIHRVLHILHRFLIVKEQPIQLEVEEVVEALTHMPAPMEKELVERFGLKKQLE